VAAFPACDDLVPYKEMELKMVSGSKTEDITIQGHKQMEFK
jgi:hypothetical protein